MIYDSEDFQLLEEIPINLLESESRETNEIISMKKCENDQYLAVLTGKNLIKEEQIINQLFIFK